MTAKELMTARISGPLRRAVAAKAAGRGETVTDVITRAFEAYIRDDPPDPPPTKPPAGPPPRPRKAAAQPPCPHRLSSGAWCKTCGHTKT